MSIADDMRRCGYNGWAMEVERLEAERDALAAHVEEVRDAYCRKIPGLSGNEERSARLVVVGRALNQSPETSLARHPDDAAVDRFAVAMKAKLAAGRAKGRDGWDDLDLCPAEFLATLLVGHIGKGNPGNLEDIAALAMMLHQRGDDPAVVAKALARLKAEWQAEALERCAKGVAACKPGATPRGISIAIKMEAEELRRQAEGGE